MDIFKPKLSVKEQIEHLKKKGVKFNVMSEEEAEIYLSTNNYYYKLTSYRKNFLKYRNGKKKGTYIDLDFAYLKDLAIIDSYLRNIILEISLDIEHYSKLKLLSKLEKHQNEDGYTIVKDFFESLTDDARSKLQNSIEAKKDSTYIGNIISKYSGDIPLWAFVEILSFGDYLRLYKFCADRWNDKKMASEFYDMMDVKELRNAAAHNNCIINDIIVKNKKHKPTFALLRSLKSISKLRNNKHLSKEKIRQLSTLLYTAHHIITSPGIQIKISKKLKEFKNRIFRDYNYCFNESLKATFDYFLEVIDIFYK